MRIVKGLRKWRWWLVGLAGLGILFGLLAQTLLVFEFPKEFPTTKVVVVFVSLLIVLAIAGLFLRRANLIKAKSKRPATNVPSAHGTTGGTNIDWTPWASSALVIASFTLLFILIAIFFPALWEWLLGQGKVFGLLVVTILVVALAAKYKPVWWLVVIMGTVLLFSWTSFPPNPLDWRQSNLVKANQATTERQATASGARATDRWELCWSKIPSSTALDPKVREKCNPVISFDFQTSGKPKRLEAQYESAGIPRRTFLEWDSETDGSCWQEDPPTRGRFQLKDIGGAYRGWCVNSDTKEEGILWLVKK